MVLASEIFSSGCRPRLKNARVLKLPNLLRMYVVAYETSSLTNHAKLFCYVCNRCLCSLSQEIVFFNGSKYQESIFDSFEFGMIEGSCELVVP